MVSNSKYALCTILFGGFDSEYAPVEDEVIHVDILVVPVVAVIRSYHGIYNNYAIYICNHCGHRRRLNPYAPSGREECDIHVE